MQTARIRTTVYLDEWLYIAAKKKAIEKRITLTDLIKEGLKKEVTGTDADAYDKKNKRYKDILELRGVFKTKKRIPFKKAREAFGEYMARRHLCSNT